MIRLGHGYDVHAFTDGDHVMLGGVAVPCGYGVLAHSDGDVALHALCDAMLGAAGLGDIGHHFPDTDPAHENASSLDLLRSVCDKLTENGLHVVNVDLTIIAQVPRIHPHISQMRERIATVLTIPTARVNVKATTTERLGFIGREEGIAAHAVALLSSEMFPS